jgi:acyl-CoA reductase-like NAD-dependent aldehyde dehydrogenase
VGSSAAGGPKLDAWRDHEWKLLIDGDLVAGEAGTYGVVNPATEVVVGNAPEASTQQAIDAARAAQQALPRWAATPAPERAALLIAAAARLRELEEQMIALTIAETGATASMGARVQVPTALDRLDRYSRDASRSIDFPLSAQASHATAFAPGSLLCAQVNRQPVGAVACISPYNFPLANAAGKIAPALAVGCTVVIKPPQQDPLGVLALAEILHEVGFPPGVVNVVSSFSAEPAVALTAGPDIDMVSFTGSTNVGKRIFEAGAPTMKRMLLELGGKGACIALDDADVERVVQVITNTWTFHSGQICTAPTRAILHRSLYQEVLDRLATFAATLKVGDPLDPTTVVGPVISGAHRDRVNGYIDSGESEGATVVSDGRRPDTGTGSGYYVGPTLLADCRLGMKVVQEEIFGPVVAAMPFDDDEEAIALANGTEFGLYDYLVTGDIERGMRVSRRLRSNVSINTGQRIMEAPFGGFKRSGVGRDGGDFGLHAYTEMQAVMWPA